MGEGVDNALHLHIGPGRLGLGLIVSSGLDAGLDVFLVSRSATTMEADAALSLLVKGAAGEWIVPLDVSELCAADSLSQVEETTRSRIEGATHLLITVSAKSDGLHDRRDFLLDVASSRAENPAKSTVFIPCENNPGSEYPELRRLLEARGVDCRSTMVNRLCLKYSENHAMSRQVVVDELSEWVIEGRPDEPATLVALNQVPHVDFVTDIRPRETRKRWLVNGAHLAVALIAHNRGIPTMDLEVSRPDRDKWVARLQGSLIRPLEQHYPDLEENTAYGTRHIASWMRHDDEVVRVLSRLRRSSLVEFFEDLNRKLLEPVRLIGGIERCPEVNTVLERLHNLLLKAESYVDFDDVKKRKVALSPVRDEASRESYARVLKPLFGEPESDKRAKILGEAFNDHRAIYS